MSEVEISIFVDEQEAPLDKSQKELLYEELKKTGPHEPQYYDVLFDLDENIEKEKPPNTNMPEILAKWLISYAIPIVSIVVTEKIKKKEVFGLSLESENSLKCLSKETKSFIQLAKGDQFQLHGFMIPRQKFGKLVQGYDYYSLTTVCDMLESGLYGPKLPLKDKNLGFFQADKAPSFIFDSPEQAKMLMLKFIKYVLESKNIHETLTLFSFYELSFLDCREIVPFELKKAVLPKVEPSLAFEEFDEQVLKIIDPIQPTKFNNYYDNILNALTQENNMPIYHLGNLLGETNSEFLNKIAMAKKHLAFLESFGNQVKDAQRLFNKLNLMKLISLEKFKTSDISSLNEKQKKIIELEYGRREKNTASLDTKLIKLFNLLPLVYGKKLGHILKEIYDSAKKDIDAQAIIQSAEICSHHYYKYSYINDFGPTNLAYEKLLADFSLPVEDNSYFCKVCGEKLGEENVEMQLHFYGDRTINIGMLDSDPIQTAIWKEATNIVSTYVKFVDPIPTKSLINSLVSGLRNVVQFEESQLFKSKNVEGTTRDSVNLIAAIYIYAALAALMYHNPGKMTFAKEKSNAKTEKNDIDPNQKRLDEAKRVEDPKQSTNPKRTEVAKQSVDKSKNAADDSKQTTKVKTGAKTAQFEKAQIRQQKHLVVEGGKVTSVKDGKKAEELTVRNALLLLVVSKDITRQKLNVTVPMLSSMFSKAYKWALDHAKPIQLDRDIAKQMQFDPITFDTFYQYINRVNLHLYFAGVRKFPPALNDIVSNIGKTREQVIKSADPYENVQLVKQWKVDLGEYRILPGYEKHIYECYLAVHEYLTQRVFSVHATPPHVRLTEYRKKYEYLKQKDAEYQKIIQWKNAKPHLHIEMKNNYAWSLNRFNNINLASHYCPSGSFHKGGEYIFAPRDKGKAKDERIIKKEEISEWIKTKNKEKLEEFAKLEIIDEKCQLCGIHFRYTTYDDQTLKKMKKIHESQDNIFAFYGYYDNRCPVNDLHEIVDNKCKKCGYNPNWKKQNDITEDPYYKKYGKQFKEMRENQISYNYTPPVYVKKQEQAVTWEYSLRYTNELSKMFDIKYNILINLGLLEKISFIYIEQTKINPSKENYSQKARALRIRDYILFAIREYMEIVKYNEVAQIKPEIKKLLDDQRKIKASENLTEGLPQLTPFVDDDERFQRGLSPEKYTNFLQEFLAKMLIDIVLQSREKDKPFAKKVVSYIIQTILRKDKFYSKAIPASLKTDATAIEEDVSDNESVGSVGSTDDVSSQLSGDQDVAEDTDIEDMDFNNDGYDVENEADIWEKD